MYWITYISYTNSIPNGDRASFAIQIDKAFVGQAQAIVCFFISVLFSGCKGTKIRNILQV